jgi:alcohol dehydrogenase
MAPLSGVDYGGGLSDFLRVPFADHMLVNAPEGLTPEAMAGATDNLTTALTLVADPLRRTPGARILVVGGRGRGVGLHVVQCAIALGADKVVYVDNDQRTLALAKRVGAEIIELTVGPDTPSVGIFPYTIDVSGSAMALRWLSGALTMKASVSAVTGTSKTEQRSHFARCMDATSP